MQRFQFGYDLFFFILWRTVSPSAFAKKVKPLLLQTSQFDSISGDELLPFFKNGLIVRDGWRLYRSVMEGAETIIHKGESWKQ